MPRNRVQIPVEERRADLVAAATELFLERGYEGATMEDISKAAGVTRANIYWYFKSKDEVFAAVMEQMLRLTTSAELTHLREMAADEPDQIIEQPGGDG